MNTSERPLSHINIYQKLMLLPLHNHKFILYYLFYILLFQPAFSGCTSKQVMLERAVIINATENIISEISVRHEPTGKVGAVSMLLPRSSFDLGFHRQPMHAETATVNWTDLQGIRRSVDVKLPNAPDASGKENSMKLVYTIQPSGTVRVELKEH